MRLFTAIEIPPSAKDGATDDAMHKLRVLLDRLRPAAKLSWTRSENLHITTKFIGEWPQARLEEMKRALESAGSPSPIRVRISGLGWFPNARNPRVLWAGVICEAPAGEGLRQLARATEDALHSIGVPKDDREYSPHLTLGRIRDRVPLDALRKAIDSVEDTEFGSFFANEFYLYLSAAGKYTKLARFGFAHGLM